MLQKTAKIKSRSHPWPCLAAGWFYEPDSTVPEAIKDNPHIAFRVDELEPHLVDAEILIPPFIVGDFLEVVFVRKHNTIFEYMRYLKDGWFDQK